ncbi:hypothetical protein EYF80_028047 [Liparis tanakae]|uniref:Uncharacterized protein n=1 Tax=Liparis tanakae TaxID=230148 RepID=A0A4Z2H740_9TELE|nr:hypothetical protein EYF80_028047 [Liparis tanakae]
MAKRTVSSYFLPKPHDIEKTNPENESHSDCEETVVAKKGRKFSFRDEWLREFTWLRCFRETSSMNRTVCCRFPQHAGHTTCADKTGTARLKHDTLIRHNAVQFLELLAGEEVLPFPGLEVEPCVGKGTDLGQQSLNERMKFILHGGQT